MKSFFSSEDIKSTNIQNGKIASCASCGLYKYVLSPRMQPFGNFKKGILNIGEAPGETEDKKGKQWQGKAGQRLQKAYKKLGIDLFEDCLNFNAINCRPTDRKGNNRSPTNNELLCCRQRVLKVIEEYRPKVIVLFGQAALQSVIGWRWTKQLGNISKWRGFTIPDQHFKAWLCPTFHPSYVERQQDSPELETIWMKDLKRAIKKIDELKWPTKPDEEKSVHFIDIEDLENINFGDTIAIDYETTGLKPYLKGHKIVCASVASGEDSVSVFMVPEDINRWEPLRKLLASKKIGKIAHNMKFEEMWSRGYLKQPVSNWVWDSMLAAHVIDNRRDITGLKFQTYIHFGEVGYDDQVSKYLQSDDPKNSNAFNKVESLIKTESGRNLLMKYCALDSLFTFRLAQLQMKILGKEKEQ